MATNTGLRHKVLLSSQTGTPSGNPTGPFDWSRAAVAFTADSGSSCPCSRAYRNTISLSLSILHFQACFWQHSYTPTADNHFQMFIQKAITGPIIFVYCLSPINITVTYTIWKAISFCHLARMSFPFIMTRRANNHNFYAPQTKGS